MSLWSIGAVCARGMWSMWIIFYSLVRLFVPYGMLFFSRFGVVLGYVCCGVEDVAFLPFVEGKE
jgi:hypothetical protein